MHKRIALLIFISLLSLSACSSPTPTATATAQPTAIPPTPTSTPTPAPPMVRVENEAECSSSPGEGGSVVAVIPAGETVSVVGKDSGEEYWVVIDPASQQGCWIKRSGTKIQGAPELLPNLVPPPTPLPPATPGNLKVTLAKCTRTEVAWINDWSVLIRVFWEDHSDSEDGFTLLRGEKELVTTGPDQTEYWDSITLDNTESAHLSYVLFAWSESSGNSERVTTEFEFSCK